MNASSQSLALVVAFDFPPSACAGVFRVLRFVRFLPEHGWDTAVLAANPLPQDATDHELQSRIPTDVHVCRVPLVRLEDALKGRTEKVFSAWTGRFGKAVEKTSVRRTGSSGSTSTTTDSSGSTSTTTGSSGSTSTTTDSSGSTTTGSSGSTSTTTDSSGSTSTTTDSSGSKTTTTDSSSAARKTSEKVVVRKTTGATLRKQVTELCFALPDNRIGWKKDAVRVGMRLIDELRPSVIFATAPPFSSLLVGRELARRSNLPLVIDFRDPWTRVPWGPRNKSWIANQRVATLERKCVSSAAAVILNTPELTEDFINHYSDFPADKFVTITNGFDPDVKSRVESYTRQDQTKPGRDRPYRLLHPGSVYRNRDPRPIVDAIAELRRGGTDVVFEQIGFCDPSFDLHHYAKERNVEDLVEIKSAMSHDQMIQRMAQVDGFVLLQPGTAVQVPGKLFEMILYKKPIMAACVPGAVSNIVNRYRIGEIADAEDASAIAKAIASLTRFDVGSADWDRVHAAFDGERLSAELAGVLSRVRGG